jgi:hypothetical protein
MELFETNRAGLVGPLEAKVLALLDEAFPDGASANGDYYARNGAPEIIVILQDGQATLDISPSIGGESGSATNPSRSA